MIARRGVERVIEVDLSPEERSAFDASAAAVKADLALLARLPKAG
jgi:malate/lactate dehydrogenase